MNTFQDFGFLFYILKLEKSGFRTKEVKAKYSEAVARISVEKQQDFTLLFIRYRIAKPFRKNEIRILLLLGKKQLVFK